MQTLNLRSLPELHLDFHPVQQSKHHLSAVSLSLEWPTALLLLRDKVSMNVKSFLQPTGAQMAVQLQPLQPE